MCIVFFLTVTQYDAKSVKYWCKCIHLANVNWLLHEQCAKACQRVQKPVFSLLILCQKSAQNYTTRKLEYSSYQTCYIASQIKDICHTHLFSKLHKKTALCKGLEGVEFGGIHQSFIMLKHKPKVGVDTVLCKILPTLLSIFQYTLFFKPNLS